MRYMHDTLVGMFFAGIKHHMVRLLHCPSRVRCFDIAINQTWQQSLALQLGETGCTEHNTLKKVGPIRHCVQRLVVEFSMHRWRLRSHMPLETHSQGEETS